eukprot:TRINITY_DN70335_c0_g1_i1.p1 TRINITY_DN70335_c0_g1~~TRINITY_DN70335_c0_g1_i1.p1  ORF type:complete len:306 (-),score=52.27 TRINITY_DN70335_c0_g1_i1:64-981(-)
MLQRILGRGVDHFVPTRSTLSCITLSNSRSRKHVTRGWERAFGDAAVRSTTASGSIVYESNQAVEEYLQFHYATKEQAFPYSRGPADALDFPARVAGLAARHSRPDRRGIAYDVGCSVGGSSFELTKTFEKVIGVDFSHAFVAAAQEMKNKGEMNYCSTVQAKVRVTQVARMPAGALPERAEFRQGDACNLGDIGEIDCMFAANLLCRLPDPAAFLAKASQSVRQGGIFVLVSPYSWLAEYTPEEKWIGGREGADGNPIDSHTAVTSLLEPSFDLVERSDEAFLLREHARKFQWGISDCTVWRRR